MFFRLKEKCGGHNQNGKDYKSGDIIESDIDLVKKWRTKFELVHDEDDKVDTGKKAPDILTPDEDTDSDDSKQLDSESVSKKKEKSGKKKKNKLGVDVTEEFPLAEEIGLKVYEKAKTNGKWYYIIDPDEDPDDQLLKKTRKKNVADFIETMVEDEEEDED